MNFYPIYLDLRGRSVLVVGGGPIATGKVHGFLEAGAQVTVVAPEVSAAIQSRSEAGELHWFARTFNDADIEDMFIVIGATDDKALNARVYQLASAQQRVANAVDDLDNCNFIAPAIARRGELQVAVSTGGASPALAKQIRDRIELELLTEDAATLADFLRSWRPAVKDTIPTYQRRQAFWEGVLESCAPALLAAGESECAADVMRICLARSTQQHDAHARCAAHPEHTARCRACKGV
ncbi:MAG: bifunctional precorrin-2 dehydrogenase/sirohydrochlorin ferrochelatase [Chloroflexi bacterium]|nr:bifunctional precorrin-2 dehydrogenase/sirohydrochlorin ferrochelatase [Chloroflexota bacterium]